MAGLRALLFLALGFAFAPCPASAHEPAPATAVKMREAVVELVRRMDDRRRAKLVLPFGDAARTDWHYTPRSRPGLSFADLKPEDRNALFALLKTALSESGHRKVANIIELERVLKEIEFALSFLRDPEKYSIVVFGPPDARDAWGWRFEGHHLSLSFTLRGNRVTTTPSFFGANPADVKKGPKAGLRVLAAEEDEARKLLAMLDAGQRKVAVIDERSYGDIVTRAEPRVSPLESRGLPARSMNEAQRAQLRKVIEVYADAFEPGLRAARLARVDEGGLENALFAWAGATERGRPHYYRIQGPRFLIEYDASQDGGNHAHTVWRDFDGDFGRDLLREHHALHH